MAIDAPKRDDDFEFHLQASKAGERKARGTQFVSVFAGRVAESITGNVNFGFDCRDRGNTQPNGQSCLIASMVASARGMRSADVEFAPSVDKLFDRAKQMGIVDQYGIDPRRRDEIVLLANEVGLEPQFYNYFPNDMSEGDIKTLADSIIDALKKGSGVAVLIPASKHYVLLHSVNQNGMRVYDPLTGSDEIRTVESVAMNMGNIVNGDMMGEKYTGNGVIIFDSVSKSDDDFVVHSQS